jgi:hypothetical protein
MFVLRFGRPRRILRILALVLFIATMLPMQGLAAGDVVPDYSAALLMPSDLEALGFDDYGVDSGRTMTLPQMLRDSGNPDWDDPAFTEVGIEWVHSIFLHPIGGLDANEGAGININIMIFVYEDEDAADEGFDLFEDESDDPTATDLDDAPEFGDDSELTEYIDEWIENGTTYAFHGLDFSIRLGNVIGLVSFNGFDSEVDRDHVEAAAEYFVDKLMIVIEDGEIDGVATPGLGNLIPRYEADEVMTSRSHYCSINGEVVTHAYDPGADEITEERIDDFGLQANYCSIQKLMLGADDEEFLLLYIQPMRFARSSGAASFVDAVLADALDDESGFEVDELDADSLPFDADEAYLLTYEREVAGLESDVAELIVRDGKFVFELRLNGLELPDVDVLLEVLADIGECVEESCTVPFDMPEALDEFLEDQIELYEDR